jgi:hypothetical protein
VRHMGVWNLTVTGPPALLAVYEGEIEITGLGGDPSEWDNLYSAASDRVAQELGFESYDYVPEQYTPIDFSEPVLGANKYRNPDGSQQWFVGVYSIGRECGGAEEGGWWFDCGDLERQVAVATRADAELVRANLRDEFPDTGKRSSVLGGEDYDIHIGIEPHPEYFPVERPRYE